VCIAVEWRPDYALCTLQAMHALLPPL
jgi:hypothetical protein